MTAPLKVVRSLGAAVGLGVCATLFGCAHENAPTPPPGEPTSTFTVTSTPPMKTPSLNVSGEIVSKCKLDLTAVDEPVSSRAPHFDFDRSDLLPADYAVLDKIAECVAHGPLEGRSLALIGRADPRGETEYNFALGARRADNVARYLGARGVGAGQLQPTSRGELDATGSNERGWAKDRRVDVILL